MSLARLSPIVLALGIVVLAGPGALSGQDAADLSAPLARALSDAQRAHLWRVAAWGGANLAAGLALLSTSPSATAPGRRGFGIQTAAWGAINVGIAAWGLSAHGMPEPGLGSVLRAEDGYAHVLLVNLGLNVGYMAVGTALMVAANHGLRGGAAVRGHGGAVVVQGLGLLVLDGIAWAGSRGRLDRLHEMVGGLQPGPDAGSVSLVLGSVPFG